MPSPSLRSRRLALILAGSLALGTLSGAPALATTTAPDSAQSTSAPAPEPVPTEPAPAPAPQPAQAPIGDAAATTDPAPEPEPEPTPEPTPDPIVTAVPKVTGEHSIGKTLDADAGTWSDNVNLTYQWNADGVAISGATGSTFTLTSAQAKKLITVTVTGTTADGRSESTTSTGLRVATVGTPKVSGTMAKGSTATASVGTWTYNTSFTYQWLADGVAISGATGKSFKITSAQSGKKLSVRVTGSKSGYDPITRTSASSSLRVMNWTTPTISGTPVYGSTLTAKRGTWTSSTAFTYRWYADGVAIYGGTGSTLKLGTGQVGKRISVKVTGKKSGHTTVAKTSASTGRVWRTASTPKITGTAIYGSTLKATPGTWSPDATRTYQWYADGVAISGATGSTLKLGSYQKNKQIRVKVTGKRSGYATVTKTSAATLRVQTAPTPKISGTPKYSYTLTANRGTWSSGTSFSYQWYADGVALSGKTSSTLKLTSGLVGKTVKVKVTGRKSGYPTVSRTSASTSRITYPLVTQPVDSWNCPSWAPIKGNASSMIYHVPGGSFYNRTNPEECFRTEAAAVAAGYRKSKL